MGRGGGELVEGWRSGDVMFVEAWRDIAEVCALPLALQENENG